NVAALPAPANEPVRSDIPTLVLNGRFDPITPPSNGAAVAATLSAAYVFTFPNSAHGAFPMNDCADGITQAFIARPDQQPDGACIDAGASIAFVGKNSLISVPVVGQMLNAPSTTRQQQFLALAAAMLVLLSGIVLMPLGWLLRLLLSRRSSRPMPFAARVMPWAAALYTFGIIVFVGGIFGAAIAAIAGNDYSFLGGVTSDILPLFSLLPVLAILTGVILWGVVAGWRSGTWGILRRLYRSALALAAIVASIVLVVWGMFNAL
ncbi:MAG: alpha/beta hydrolase, partial [Chloroflexi bacterium]|nr:alpha/beta hydrolase [Chloroflexota bacterium]